MLRRYVATWQASDVAMASGGAGIPAQLAWRTLICHGKRGVRPKPFSMPRSKDRALASGPDDDLPPAVLGITAVRAGASALAQT